MLPPGCSLSRATASATSLPRSVEFRHVTSVSVLEATYFCTSFRCFVKGSPSGAFGQYAAMIS